jgi:hypothetical protein
MQTVLIIWSMDKRQVLKVFSSNLLFISYWCNFIVISSCRMTGDDRDNKLIVIQLSPAQTQDNEFSDDGSTAFVSLPSCGSECSGCLHWKVMFKWYQSGGGCWLWVLILFLAVYSVCLWWRGLLKNCGLQPQCIFCLPGLSCSLTLQLSAPSCHFSLHRKVEQCNQDPWHLQRIWNLHRL